MGTSGIADRSRIEYESNKTQDSLVNRVFLETGVQLNKVIERVKNEGYTSTTLVSPFETEKKHISLSNYIVNESIKFIEKKNNVSVFKADFYICIAITKYNYIYPFGDYCHIYQVRVNGLMHTEIDPKLILNVYKGLELEYTEDDIDLRNY
ncbi:hypothetical protein [Bernardetia litoralis]|uniref:hypothetical protein n=1 Tax=Bernardetia litoralis TaxID=999 RepID=UPI0012FD072F|nr:hypothetical protein [Bernardetia litoralis]